MEMQMLKSANPFDLSGRVALVTGAGSGIGRAIAEELATAGAAVMLVDRNEEALLPVAARFESLGVSAATAFGDVSNPATMIDAVSRAQSRLGSLTLAVNAAGIANAAPAEEMPLDQWQQLYDVDITGVFLSCQAEGAAMLANGGGSIVNIASMSGTIVNRGLQQAHYNSAKAAVIHFSRSIAVEWATRGVRVNALSPGYTATPMNARPEMTDRMREFAESVPMQRIAEPREIARPALFLLSDAASYITGIDLLVDGGHTAW
jgi:NAD(P)-dependent dehydrogenase (short-subunit alcohol dehydrogenase family)